MPARARDVETAARALLAAEREGRDRRPVTEEWPALDLPTVHRVQERLTALRIEGGESVIGVELGLTSRAKQVRMGISAPLTGVLTDAHALAAGQPVPLGELIHPRVEPEIVFVMGRRLAGPGVTAATALAAVDRVVGGLEVIDSRFRDFRSTLPDVIADNASAARSVLGSLAVAPRDLDLVLEAVVLSVNGTVVDTATGAAVHGNPAEALGLAANALGERGAAIEAGALVLTGGLTDAIPIGPGDEVAAEFTSLSSVTLTGAA